MSQHAADLSLAASLLGILIIAAVLFLAPRAEGASREEMVTNGVMGCLVSDAVRARGYEPTRVVPLSAAWCRAIPRLLPPR